MDDSLLENLGISSRLRWYHDHINVNGNLSKTWQCFLHDVNGTIPITNDLQLHKLSFGPLISEGSHTSILPKEQLSCLYSIKPGPIPGLDVGQYGVDVHGEVNEIFAKRKADEKIQPHAKKQK